MGLIILVSSWYAAGKFISDSEAILGGIIGLLITMTSERISEIIDIKSYRRKEIEDLNSVSEDAFEKMVNIEDQISYLQRTLDSRFELEKIAVDDIHQVIENLVFESSKVLNTFVGMEDSYYSNEDVFELYGKYLSREGAVWWDVVSINELFSDRFERIKVNEKRHKERIHEIVVLRHSVPFINFMIFVFPNNRASEVVFGWTEGRFERPGNIFRSANPQIVDLFEGIFRNLWNRKRMSHIVVDYSKSGKERLYTNTNFKTVDKVGLWYTHAYMQGMKIRTALIRVSFLNGKPIIKGVVSDPEPSPAHEEEVDHRDPRLVDHSEDRIYVEYTRNADAVSADGFVLYKFSRRGGEDVVTGFFTDGRTDKSASIIGVRVDDPKASSGEKITIDDLRSIHRRLNAHVGNLASRKRGVGNKFLHNEPQQNLE
jgi:hypothetical protein